MLMWVFWNNRNSHVWHEKDDPGRMLGMKAQHMWSEWVSVQQLQRRGIKDHLEGESFALLAAMKVMEQRDITNVVFETDSKSVVDAIHHLRGAVADPETLGGGG
ncbi:hypothetical protein QL285_001570 [Trifolium repens]|nr:hypothetical protein QL285_001570 [Trifolium repens]